MDRDLVSCSTEDLSTEASALRDFGKGRTVTFSPKVFIPLTKLCRNACGYCDYREDAINREPFLAIEDALKLARVAERAGCTEALLVTGDKPELAHRRAADWLEQHGFRTTADYACATARLILRETRLFPHTNCGICTEAELARLREVNVSLGLMLESTSPRLGEQGGAHEASPDKEPDARINFLEACGRLRIATTTGLLVGFGETRRERLESLYVIRDLNQRYGHIQEIIIQNFRPKPGTPMAVWTGPDLDEMVWTVAAARIVLGPAMNLQSPPNLLAPLLGGSDGFGVVLDAGINDWGGISPVTRDAVNRAAPWPVFKALRDETEARGFRLRARFPVYPEFIVKPGFLDPALGCRLAAAGDQDGYVKEVPLDW